MQAYQWFLLGGDGHLDAQLGGPSLDAERTAFGTTRLILTDDFPMLLAPLLGISGPQATRTAFRRFGRGMILEDRSCKSPGS